MMFFFLLLLLLTVFPKSTTAENFNNQVPHTNRSRIKGQLSYEFGPYSAPSIIQSKGYPVEVHRVVTDDGYILEMHRIPGPRYYRRNFDYSSLPGYGRVAYIQHCVFCSSGDFVINEPNAALAFILADAGFDVWMGNYRGNAYSRRHVKLNPQNRKFWQFSFMEMAKYDIPAMMYYILDTTGHQNLTYIGHSMGTTGLFATLSLHPQMNKYVRVMAAMAPVAYLNNMKGPFRHLVELASHSYNNIAAVIAHIPSGASARTLAHLGQLVRSGPRENMLRYGQEKPPPFDLGQTKVPVGIFWSKNDWVATPRDVRQTTSELVNVVYIYRVPQDDFNHSDFLFSKTAKNILYTPLLRFILRY